MEQTPLSILDKTHLDRRSFKPIYFQLGELIQNLIDDGKLEHGMQLPSERELMDHFDISRNTVRKAIDSLISDGLVYRVQGKGTFVAASKMQYGLFGLKSFSEEMRMRGLKPGGRVLDCTRLRPSPRISQALQLEEGQEVYRIERLRTADDEPMALHTSYIPQEFVPDLDEVELEDRSLYTIFEEDYHLIIWRAERALQPVIARDYEVEMLNVQPETPLLLVEGTTYLVEDHPVEYAKIVYRSDRFQFRIHSLRRVVHDPIGEVGWENAG